MPESSMRYRVNVARGVKGGTSFECTTDCEGFTMEYVLAQHDKLVGELNRRYPPEVAEKKEK